MIHNTQGVIFYNSSTNEGVYRIVWPTSFNKCLLASPTIYNVDGANYNDHTIQIYKFTKEDVSLYKQTWGLGVNSVPVSSNCGYLILGIGIL